MPIAIPLSDEQPNELLHWPDAGDAGGFIFLGDPRIPDWNKIFWFGIFFAHSIHKFNGEERAKRAELVCGFKECMIEEGAPEWAAGMFNSWSKSTSQ